MGEPRRVLIAFDGTAWFARRILTIAEDSNSHKVYRCDEHLGGPFAKPEDALTAVMTASSLEDVAAMQLAAKKRVPRVSASQRQALMSVRKYGDPWVGVYGSSQHGGWQAVIGVLQRNNWVHIARRGNRDRWVLTPAGRDALKRAGRR